MKRLFHATDLSTVPFTAIASYYPQSRITNSSHYVLLPTYQREHGNYSVMVNYMLAPESRSVLTLVLAQ